MSIVEKFNQSPVQRKFDAEFQGHAQALREIIFRTTFGAYRDAFWRLIHRAEDCALTTADVDRCAHTAEALFAEAVRGSAEERSPAADEALAAAMWYDEFARRLRPYVRDMPLCVYVDGKPGPHSSELISAWIAARVGGKCPRCSTTLEESWGSIMPDCETCRNEWAELHGDRCGGTGTCPECLAVGIDKRTREPKCEPECSTLCPFCNPDD